MRRTKACPKTFGEIPRCRLLCRGIEKVAFSFPETQASRKSIGDSEQYAKERGQYPDSEFPTKENNPRTALAGLTTNEFQIVINLFVVNAARHVLLLLLFLYSSEIPYFEFCRSVPADTLPYSPLFRPQMLEPSLAYSPGADGIRSTRRVQNTRMVFLQFAELWQLIDLLVWKDFSQANQWTYIIYYQRNCR
jgi:hypothetical protein